VIDVAAGLLHDVVEEPDELCDLAAARVAQDVGHR
jgi:hypothetical protein